METHIPVMLQEIVGIFEHAVPSRGNAFFVDATLGGGGHSKAMLERFPNLRIVGLDRDETALALAASRLSGYGTRFTAVHANFGELSTRAAALRKEHGGYAIGVLFDYGVSNMQLSTPERGFSFQEDGSLDMRMSPAADIPTAADIIRESGTGELAGIFRVFGEEKNAFRIAKGITCAKEAGETLDTTMKLVAAIRRSLPAAIQRHMGGNPARKIFQALRIAVNSELEEIPKGLEGALELTGDGGFIVSLSYHSLEDRLVKRTFKNWEAEGRGFVRTKRPAVPSEEETNANRKARSAKMRVFAVKKGNDILKN
ncbi:MAG: 16S rRNA (cytosine(1402)-N(4))-methyltransferase RsmH [Synergistaceae bacterium]|jgi:16S rRNA (cytosine1402-N4)-methyltransferase|nr:16S rRNA (cytosine(1402)-N(4))-methyltransferase RsmH [Synergistaceae bacterium]